MKKIMSVLISIGLVFTLLPVHFIPILANDESTLLVNDFDEGERLNQVQYQGDWKSDEGYTDLFYGGDDHWITPDKNGNTFDNSYLTITFFGTAIQLYGTKEEVAGIQEIYIDGIKVAEIDTYSKEKQIGVCLFDSKDFFQGTNTRHVLQYKASGRKNAASSGYNMQFDYAKVMADEQGALQFAEFAQQKIDLKAGEEKQILPIFYPAKAEAELQWSSSNGNVHVEEDGTIQAMATGEATISAYLPAIDTLISYQVHVLPNNLKEMIINDDEVGEDFYQFSYQGNWVHEGGYPNLFEGGDEHWITKSQFDETLPSFTLRFVGTKAAIYGHRTAEGAIAKVMVDGKEAGIIDYYLPSRLNKQLLFETGELEEGEHTIVVSLDGTHHSDAGSSLEAAVDYAVVTHSDRAFEATGIRLHTPSILLEEGMKFTNAYTILPSYATIIPDVIWRSENTSIATVDAVSGEIMAKAPGSTTIFAQLKGTTIITSMQVQVIEQKESFSAMVADNNRHAYPDDYETYLKQYAVSGTADLRSWKGTAWKNDEISSRIDILTKGDLLQNVVLEAEDFISAEQNQISKDQISMSFMKNPLAYTNGQHIMDVITNSNQMDLAAQQLIGVWVNIKVPETTVPGTYFGKLHIRQGNDELAVFDYTLEVLDLTLESMEDNKQQMELWMYPYSSNRYYANQTTAQYYGETVHDLRNVYLNDAYEKGLESQLELYRKAGGKAITVTVVEDPWNSQTPDPYPSMIKWTKQADGTFCFDYTDFDKWVALNMKHGIDQQIKSFSMSCWGNRITYLDEADQQVKTVAPATGSDTWKAMWTAFLQDYVKHLDKQGWFDITYMAMDERPLNEILPVLDLIESVLNKEGKPLKTSLAVFDYDAVSIFDRIDDLSLAYQMGSSRVNEIAADRKQKGLITTMYTCGAQNSAMLNQPGESAYSIVHAYKYGTQGFLRWAFDSFNDDPLITSQHRILAAGDIYLIYPDERNHAAMQAQSSPRFEKLIEGERIIQKLQQLSMYSDEVKKEIDDLMNTLGNGDMSAEVQRIETEINRMSKELLFGKVEPGIQIQPSSLTLILHEEQQLQVLANPEDLLETAAQKTYINDFDETISYQGNWTTDENYPDLFYHGDDHWCAPIDADAMKNHSYAFNFIGDQIAIFGNKEIYAGMLDIYIDGTFMETVDPYSPYTLRHQQLFKSELLTMGPHHIEVRGNGNHHPAASSYNMQFDYAIAYQHVAYAWQSDNPEIVSVDTQGNVMAHAVGSSKVQVKIPASDYVASLTIKVIADKTLLRKAIKDGGDQDASQFTTTSKKAWDALLQEANDLLVDDDASQEAIDTCVAAIQRFHPEIKAGASLIDSLKKAVQSLVAVEDRYTEEEFAAARLAMEKANEILQKAEDELGVSEVHASIMEIMTAKDKLTHNVMLEALKILRKQAVMILSSDEIDTVRPAKVRALRDAVKEAQALIDEESTDMEAIAAVQNNIYKAIHELYQIVDKNMLKELAASARALDEEKYTSDTWNAMIKEVEAAEYIVHDQDATLEAVEQSYDALTRAIIELKIKTDKSALQEQLALANEVQRLAKNYVPSTIIGLPDVIEEAQIVYDNKEATQAEINAATNQLVTALANARLKADKSGLESAVAQARAKNLALYTSASGAKLEAALKEAEKVLANEAATKAEVDTALQLVNHAVKALTKVPHQQQPNIQSSIQTGDQTSIWMLTLLLGVSMLLTVFTKRKKNR